MPLKCMIEVAAGNSETECCVSWCCRSVTGRHDIDDIEQPQPMKTIPEQRWAWLTTSQPPKTIASTMWRRLFLQLTAMIKSKSMSA